MKFFTKTKGLGPVFLTLGGMVLLACIYVLIYLPKNERKLDEQAFRSLQNTDQNIHLKLENSAALLNGLLAAYDAGNDSIDGSRVDQYIKSYSTKNFTLLPKINLPDIDSFVGPTTDSAYIVQVDSTTLQFNLSLFKRDTEGQLNKKGVRLGMRFRFEQFVKPLLAEDVFDQYVVLSNGKVMYETFPSGLDIKNQDSLLAKTNGLTRSTIRNEIIGGVEYKMYLQPIAFDGNNKWIMCGLITSERFQHEKNQLPLRFVLLLLTITLTLLVAIPWLKLYHMGSKDRLTTSDGFWSLVVSMLMMSLLFFMMFKYNADYRPNDIPDAKKVLAKSMEKAFLQEVKAAYQTLSAFDSLHKTVPTDVRKLGKADSESGKLYKHNSPIGKPPTAIDSIAKNINMSQVYWLSKDGDEIDNWTSDNLNSPPGNFKARSYFQKIDSGIVYQVQGQPADSFYLDQIISWTTATFRTVISKKSVSADSRAKVVAMSFDMQCLNKTIMPVGKSFAIIGRDGKVLYHTQKKRNLNENLLTELSESGKLRSCIEAHFADDFNTRYLGKEYRVQIQPLGNLPYFIVIFSDQSFIETYGMEIFGFTTSMLFLFFLFILLQLLMVFIVSSSRTFFKKSVFDTSWIGPKISCRKQYAFSAIFNAFILFLLCGFYHHVSPLTFLFMLLASVLLVGLFLNCLFYKRYRMEKRQPHLCYKLKTITWISTFVIIVNFTAFFYLEKPLLTILPFELICIVVGIILYLNESKIAKKITNSIYGNFLKRKSFITYFSLMSLLRLIITSGMPAVLFYSMAYNYEQNLIARYIQHNFAEKLNSQHQTNIINKPNTLNSNGVYIDSVYINRLKQNPNSLTTIYTKEDQATFQLLKLFRFFRSENAEKLEHFNLPAAADSSFLFNHMLSEACSGNCGTTTYYRSGQAGDYTQLCSVPVNYRLPDIFKDCPKGLIFWLTLLAILIIFYFTIKSVIKKLFTHNLPDIKWWNNFNDLLLQNNDLNNRIFIIGAPGSRKLSKLLEKITSGKMFGGLDGKTSLQYNAKEPALGNVLLADMICIPDAENKDKQGYKWTKLKNEALTKEYELIIVDHFEYNIKCQEANIEKLNFLESLVLRNRSKIIILSTVHPVNFLDSFNEEQNKNDKTALMEMSLDRWQVLLGHFSILALQLEADNTAAATTDNVILRETKYTDFLQKMRPTAIQTAQQIQLNKEHFDRDALAYKIQITAHNFYLFIWQSLTKEEKFLLYDLAEDGLVNGYDDYNLCMLMSKGIIIRYDGTLRLFNHGFRNFILTAIGNKEAMKIKEKITDNGNWGRLKTPIIVVIVALLAFLLASQQETYSKLIAYVTALAAGVPAVFRVFSFFDKTEDKKAT
jgi:hypothetical protein